MAARRKRAGFPGKRSCSGLAAGNAWTDRHGPAPWRGAGPGGAGHVLGLTVGLGDVDVDGVGLGVLAVGLGVGWAAM